MIYIHIDRGYINFYPWLLLESFFYLTSIFLLLLLESIHTMYFLCKNIHHFTGNIWWLKLIFFSCVGNNDGIPYSFRQPCSNSWTNFRQFDLSCIWSSSDIRDNVWYDLHHCDFHRSCVQTAGALQFWERSRTS